MKVHTGLTNGTIPPSPGYTAEELDRLTAAHSRLHQEDLSLGEAMTIVRTYTPHEWLQMAMEPNPVLIGAVLYADTFQWHPWLAEAKQLGVDWWAYEALVKTLHARLQPPASTDTGTPLVIDLDTVQERPIEWLWYPYIAIGKLCILDGDPGVGKTLLATQLAANVSRGYPMPDQAGRPTLSCGAPGVVVFLATEDDLEDTVKPRLVKAGADCTKVKAFNEWQDGAGQRHAFTLADLPHLETVLQTTAPRLVYIDAIQAVLGGKVDANRANQLKELLDPLTKLAATYRCAILASRHPAKPGQNNVKLIHRGANSMAIIGTARLGLYAEDHPTDPTKVLLLQSKSNAGAMGRTQVFSKKDGLFAWAGVSRITKEHLAGSAHGPNSGAWLEAFFWLEERLEGGLAWPASDIELQATEVHDLAAHTLKRAKKALGVVSAKGSEADAGWTWRLPPLPVSTPPTSTSSTTSSTSTTSTSLDNSRSCGQACGQEAVARAGGVEVEEVEDVEEVEVDGVVTGASVDATVNTSPGMNLSPFEDEACLHEHVNDAGTCNDCGVDVDPPPPAREPDVILPSRDSLKAYFAALEAKDPSTWTDEERRAIQGVMGNDPQSIWIQALDGDVALGQARQVHRPQKEKPL